MLMSPFFLLLCVLVAADTEQCDYVKNTYLLEDPIAVRDCFNSYVLPSSVADGALIQLAYASAMYPYADIAKNPPSYPSQEYFGKVDIQSAFAELQQSLDQSDNVVSNVFRAIGKFVNGFRDGHFYIVPGDTPDKKNMFSKLAYFVPFAWNYLPDSKGDFHVYVFASLLGTVFNLGNQTYLSEMFSKGVYAETVDGKNALEYFRDFFGVNNNMRSQQGRLHNARMQSIDGASMLQSPPEDDAFLEHVITFSNGDEYRFNITFVNMGAPTSKGVRSPPLKLRFYESDTLSDLEILKRLRDYKPKILKDINENKYVKCSVRDKTNYLSVPSFSVENIAQIYEFGNELVTCVSEFDKNTNPIIINFPGNLGGAGALTSLLSGLFHPSGDNEYLQAVRKTDITMELVQEDYLGGQYLDDDKCSELVLYGDDFKTFWNVTESDNYGNGVVHERTQLLSSYSVLVEDNVKEYSFKKNIRKPTDIIIVTDGVCFSACSIFVNNVIEKGSGIVAGVGGYNPGDELFVASQNPSQVLTLSEIDPTLEMLATRSGVKISCTFSETFPVIKEEGTLIPRDYTLSYIDKHLGVYPLVTEFTTEYDDDTVNKIIDRSLAVHQEFQEKCNPKNKRLMFVTNECKSSDKNAMFVGYQCGDDGKWDKSKCLISSCKYGYHVDFKNDKCVPSHCLGKSNSGGMNKAFFIVSLIALAVILL